MLEGLEINIKSFKSLYVEVDDTFRIDSEHYQKKYQLILNKLKAVKHERLDKLIAQPVMTGHTPSMKIDRYYGGSIKFIKTDNLRENYIKQSFSHYLSEEGNETRKNSSLKTNDIITTIIGATEAIVGRTSIIQGNLLPANINQNIALIRVNPNKIEPNFLNIYLNTKFGRGLLYYHSRQTEQVNLNCREVERILIPIFKKLEIKIKEIVLNIEILKTNSKSSYQEAKAILLQTIGLEGFESKITDNYQEISLSKSFRTTTRLDSEYYHPKPLFLIHQLKKKEYFLVKELFDIGNGYSWKSKYFKEKGQGEPFVRIRNCKPGYIDNENLTTLDSDYAKKEKVEKAKENDIVIGMDGIKYFYGSLITNPVYINQRVCHLTPKENSKIDSELVLMIINSVIGQTQLMREMTIAQTVGRITNASVGNLIIPKLEEKIRNEISGKIKESHHLEEESLRLLEVAKKAVEIAIEENEGTALKFISNAVSRI